MAKHHFRCTNWDICQMAQNEETVTLDWDSAMDPPACSEENCAAPLTWIGPAFGKRRYMKLLGGAAAGVAALAIFASVGWHRGGPHGRPGAGVRASATAEAVGGAGQVVADMAAAALQGGDEGAAPLAATSPATTGERIDVVFVMDLTSSMGRSLEGTRQTLDTWAQDLGSSAGAKDTLRLGIWGYRDPFPELGFTTHNYTPELQPVVDFRQTMATVAISAEDSHGVEESVFVGLRDAIRGTRWRPDATRLVILVGDAPGHALGTRLNPDRLDAAAIRRMASENGVQIVALQLRADGAAEDPYAALAKKQFQALASNPERSHSDLYEVALADESGYRATLRSIMNAWIPSAN